jgi:hypothetical protein
MKANNKMRRQAVPNHRRRRVKESDLIHITESPSFIDVMYHGIVDALSVPVPFLSSIL